MKKNTLITLIFTCCFTIAYSQAGELDSTFGVNGTVRAELGEPFNYGGGALKVLPDSDGSMYVLGYFGDRFVISRRFSDGSIDSGYGKNGFSSVIYLSPIPSAVAMQADGKLVVAGYNTNPNSRYLSFVLSRFNRDGSHDTTFDGTHLFTPKSVVIQSDGKIVVAGQLGADIALARYNTDGSPDESFSEDGMQIIVLSVKKNRGSSANSVSIQSDGKIVVAGSLFVISNAYEHYDFALMRCNSDGSLDSTFDTDGIQTTDFGSRADYAFSVAIQSDGKIVVGGHTGLSADFAIARYNSDGSADSSFSEDGKQKSHFGSSERINSIAIQKDGKIVAAGMKESPNFPGSTYFILAHYNTDGSLDSTFGKNGWKTTDIGSGYGWESSMAFQADGKIVMIGYNGLYRFNLEGSFDNTFDEDGKLTDTPDLFPYTHYTSTASQSDGKLVVAGQTWTGSNFDLVVARYSTIGDLDDTFGSDGYSTVDVGSASDIAKAVAIQQDGKIVAAVSNALVRFNHSGSLDSSFDGDGIRNTDFSISSLVIDSNGKIVAGGSSIGRFNPDGSPDKTFSEDGIQITDFAIATVVLQNSGKIVVAGPGDVGKSVFALARYNSDGHIDDTFGEDGRVYTDFSNSVIAGAFASCAAVQKDGKIVVGGSVWKKIPWEDYIVRYHDFALARYNSDGSLDPTFSEDGKQITNIEFANFHNGEGSDFAKALEIQGDGKIVLAGMVGLQTDPTNAVPSISAVARYNTDGTPDSAFSEDGKLITPLVRPGFHGGGDIIEDIAISENKLYMVGHPWAEGGFTMQGVIMKYQLDVDSTNKPPTITLTIPYDIVKYTGPARIKLNATATDKDGTITKVRFYNGTTKLHTETVFPYGFLWVNVPVGNYTLTAKAFDNSGNVSTSNVINVSVVDENVPPVVSIVSPVDDTTYTGPATIHLIAKAKDPNDRISKVEFYHGTTLIRTEKIYPYAYTWNNVQPGNYILTAKATDDKGLSATSEPVTITVTAPNVDTCNVQIDEFGNSLHFDGADDYLSIGGWFNEPVFTIEFWINPASTQNTYAMIVDNNHSGGIRWNAQQNGSNTNTYAFGVGLNGGDVIVLYTLTANVWQHVALVKASDFVAVYVNGTRVNYAPCSGTINGSGEGDFIRMGQWAGGERAWKGHMDEIRFWNDVRTPLEISGNMNSKIINPASETSLVAYYRCDQGIANGNNAGLTSVTDLSTYAHDASLVNFGLNGSTSNWVRSGAKEVCGNNIDDNCNGLIDENCTTNTSATSEPVAVTVTTSNVLMVNSKLSISSTTDLNSVSLKLSPNPASNILQIYTSGLPQNKQSTISVVSVSGVVLKTLQATSNKTMKINVSSLKPGVYFLKVLTGDKVLYSQFVKL